MICSIPFSNSELLYIELVVYISDSNFNLTVTNSRGEVLLALIKFYQATVLDFSTFSYLSPMVDIIGPKILKCSRVSDVIVMYISPVQRYFYGAFVK